MKDNDFQKYESIIEPKINYLTSNKLYIEAYLYLSAVLEVEMMDLIDCYEEFSDLKIKEYRKKNIPKMTLGKMKDYLSIFDDSNSKELEFFIGLRNKCIHKIFSNNLEGLSKEIKDNMNRFYKLLTKLVKNRVYLLKRESVKKEKLIKKMIKKSRIKK